MSTLCKNTIRKLEAAGHVCIGLTWATNSRETIQGKDTFKLQLTEQRVFRVNAEHTNLRSTNIWGVALKRDTYPSISTAAAIRFSVHQDRHAQGHAVGEPLRPHDGKIALKKNQPQLV